MTSEERFERIEHVTAALVEERRKDREEYRQLWRDTNAALTAFAAETRAAIAHTNAAIDRFATETRWAIEHETERAKAAEQQLRDRVDAMVSGIGQLIKQLSQRPPQ
jgi:hypothetical protein